MMQDAVLNFAKQFSYQPKIEQSKGFKKKKYIVVLGMGGSHLAADIALSIDPNLPITIHSDYGIPPIDSARKKDTLIIASSYSGNTAEVIDGFLEARKKKLPLAVIAVGGKLIELAKTHGVPYIQLPDTGIQPRSALGFSLLALFKLMGQTALLKQAQSIATKLKPAEFESIGKVLAVKIKDKVPVIYASTRNRSVAYNWKIKLNETGKIPAFYNVIPELNHNESNGFDVAPSIQHLCHQFVFFFLVDKADLKKNTKRLTVLKKLYDDRGIATEMMELKGSSPFLKIFTSLVIADWVAVHTALGYGLDPEQVPMVEEFKRLMK